MEGNILIEFNNNLGDEHIMLRDTIRKMVQKEHHPEEARKIDEASGFPLWTWRMK